MKSVPFNPTTGQEWRIFCFCGLMTVCLALSVAVLCGVRRDDMDYTIFRATAVCGFLLLAASLICLRRFGRLAVCGLIVGVVTLFICLLPTA